MTAPELFGLVHPEWPPLRHVRRGWEHLTVAERAEVAQRVEGCLAEHTWGTHPRDSLLHLFTFLAQVETIAIEIPLRFLPHAPTHVRPLLRRQLVDEVFHSALFARLAHDLAAPASQPPPPTPSAERLLERIRREPDLAVTATLLNLVAEGWIETLFKHALHWGIAPTVFKAVLADEARHVTEAAAYTKGMDLAQAQTAVRAFEQGMLEVGMEPSVALSILDVAGEEGHRRLARDLFQQHERNLAAAGLKPSPEWSQMAQDPLANPDPATAASLPRPRRVEDTQWRKLARRVWMAPRDPTMQGDFDVPVGHIPRKALTPVLIAALGRAWARHPELNRIVARDGVWELPHANVGVRVLLDGDELATVIIPEADRRSVRDIRRMLADGIAQLQRTRKEAEGRPTAPLPDPEVAKLMPALAPMFSVALSNAGKWGVVSGAGSFSGYVSPSTDITVGLRRRLPRWRGVAYLPSWHVNIAAIQDHRVFDGRASATAVTAIQAALSPAEVKAILATKDTLPSDEALHNLPEMRMQGANMGTPAFAVIGALGLPKYAPIAIGGLGLGVLFGVGGYLLYQNLYGTAGAVVGKAGLTKTVGATSAPSLQDPGTGSGTPSATKTASAAQTTQGDGVPAAGMPPGGKSKPKRAQNKKAHAKTAKPSKAAQAKKAQPPAKKSAKTKRAPRNPPEP